MGAGLDDVISSELLPDTLCDHGWWRTNIYPDVRFVRYGILEVRKLTVEQAQGHEVRLPRRQALCNGRLRTGQEHEHDPRAASIDYVSIGPFESRARD